MVRRSASRVALLFAIAATAGAAAQQPPDGTTFTRDRRDPHWLHARMIVRGDLEVAWSLLRDVRRWPDVYGDIRSVNVLSHRGSRWRIRVEPVDDDDTLLYDVTVDETRHTVVSILQGEPSDVRSRLTVVAGATPGTVEIRHSLYIVAGGIGAWFVSEDHVHGEQRRILRDHMRWIRAAVAG